MPAGAFAPSKLHIDYGEWTPPAIGSADNGKAWVWNSSTAKYEPAAFEPLGNAAAAAAAAVSTHVGLSNPHSQYLLSSAYTLVAPGGSTKQVQYNNAGAFGGDAGMTYDAATDRLTVAGGLIAPSMRPASDSTTSLQWQDATGTPFVYGDTTNRRLELRNYLRWGGIDASNQLAGLDFFRPGSWGMRLATDYVTGDVVMYDTTSSPIERARFNRAGGFSTSGGTAIFDSNIGIGAIANARTIVARRYAGTPRTDALTLASYRADGSSTPARLVLTTSQGTGNGIAYLKIIDTVLVFQQESSTTAAQDVGIFSFGWIVNTHAIRTSRGKFSAYSTTTEQEAMRWDGDAGGVKIGFYGVGAVARQLLPLGSSNDDIINALNNSGLTRLS